MELKTDLDCLIECLRYRHDDGAKARDTILTIASLCSGSDEAQNFLRTSGGLSFIVNLLSTTQDEGIQVAALYALGCATERNVFSQSRLCTEAMFRFLYCQLTSEYSGVQMKRTATFLIMCLVTNNGKGQTLVRKTKCLDAMLQLFRQFPGLHLPYSPDTRCLDEEDQKLSLELWKDVTGTLCGCVNNPQNDENQLVCASSVPAALYIMSQAHDDHVIQLLCSYISLLAANNAVNQDRFHMLGGLEVIVSKLTYIIDDIVTHPEKGMISSASNMISMLSSVISDNDNNLQALSTLEVVPLLLKLLALDVIRQGVKLKVIITLGCLVSANEGSKKQVVECDGLKLLLSFMMANQDEECAKAATLVLHSCISSDKESVAEEDGKGIMSEKGHSSSKNEGQAVERSVIKGQQKELEAKIDILQKALLEERRLRKSLEDEKASLQLCKGESTAMIIQEEDEASVCTQDLPPKPYPKSPAPAAKDQEEEQQVTCNPDMACQPSSSFVQLQERMNVLEQKIQNITTGRSETEMKNNTTISDVSGSDSANDVHCSVSDAENEEIKLSHINMRYCEKMITPATTKENTSKDTCQQQVTIEKDRYEESPQFKVPPPVKRYRPLQLVHGNTSFNKKKSVSLRIKTFPQGIKHHQDRGEVTPPAKVQKVDMDSRTSCRESLDPSTKHKEKQVNQEMDSDADSASSDASEVSSIADSVFSSLNLHLSCPIRPIKRNPSQTTRHCHIQPLKHSPKVAPRPVKSTMHLAIPEMRTKEKCTKLRGKDSDTIAKSKHVSDFEEDLADSKRELSHKASCISAIRHPLFNDNYKGHISTPADHLKNNDMSEELVAKLKATPKVMLKKTSLKGKNVKIYTFDGKPQAKDLVCSRDSSKQGNHRGESDRMPHLPKHQGGFGLQKGPARIFTTKGNGTKGSGSKRKSYSVHYVRGKIQCSRLYRSASRSTSGNPDAYYSTWLKCPGCIPPRHLPLLDSRTLLQTLVKYKHNLCRKHSRLIDSITSYISIKMNLFGL